MNTRRKSQRGKAEFVSYDYPYNSPANPQQQITPQPVQPVAPPAPPSISVNETNKEVQLENTCPPNSSQEMEVGETSKDRPKWATGVRRPKHVRLKRLNAALAKKLAPKPAALLLHELLPDAKVETHVKTNGAKECVITLGDEQLCCVEANSKIKAKALAAEKVIKGIIEKMLMAPQLPPAPQPETNNGDEEVFPESNDNSPESNIPWAGLAGFAIYKLLECWKSEDATTAPKKVHVPIKPMTKMPENPTSMHPLMLLKSLHPNVETVELETFKGSQMFKVDFVIDGKLFTGTAPSKKAARKEAAKVALASLYNIQYPETPMEVSG